MNWTVIPRPKTKNTIWDKPIPNYNVDYSTLVKYFCEPKKKEVISKENTNADAKDDKKAATVKILDDKKQMNLSISLNKFRISPEELKGILENLEEDKINLEEIQKLIDLGPTEEEVAKLKEYKGDLNLISLGERYCYVLANINRFQIILDAMKFKKIIGENKKEIVEKLNLIKDGLNSIKESKSFEDILKMLLYVGNYLNTDMAKGNAIGVNITVLNMLENIKSNVGEKYTLLEIFVMNIRSKELNLLNFYKDFNDFEPILPV